MPRTPKWRRCLLPLLALPLIAADPLPYAVDLPPTNDAPLDAALKETSSLIRLRESAPVGPFALLSRARTDRSRLHDALDSFGRYDATVAIRIDNHDIDDPTLPDLLDAAPGPVAVAIAITPGPVFKLRRLTLQTPPDPASTAIAHTALGLHEGDPAQAAEVLAAATRMQDALRAAGHALATVQPPAATLDPTAQALDVAYTIDPGPIVNLGPIAIEGAPNVDRDFIRRRLLIHQNDRFDPAKIEAARQDLASIGVFASVQAKPAPSLDAEGQIPIAIDLTERPRHAVGATAAYSTDLGASAGLTWQHRNLFGAAEHLDIGLTATGLGGAATSQPGYNATAALTKPDILTRDQSITISLQAVSEFLDAYNRQAILAGIQLSRKLTPELLVTAGLAAQRSHVTQESIARDYTLLGLPIGLTYDSTGAQGLFEPTAGIKASLLATPTASLGAGGQFTILQATASTYFDLARFGTPEGRSVLALRATLASIQGASALAVPPDQRLYAGGSATVRGYRYQSIGPRFASNRPIGGASLAAATVEFRQRFGESFGTAIFADAGQVGSTATPGAGGIRAGAGAGARYYTPIGPIRLDIALPLNRQRGDDTFELYIGIGQAF